MKSRRTLAERLLSGEESSNSFADVTNHVKGDRSLLRHFATLHDSYFRGDTALSSKEAKTAMGALLTSMWGKVPGVQALGQMEPQPNITEFIRLLDEVGEGPLGSFFGFRGPDDVPGGADIPAAGEEPSDGSPIPTADGPPSNIDPNAPPTDQNLDDEEEEEDRAWTPISP